MTGKSVAMWSERGSEPEIHMTKCTKVRRVSSSASVETRREGRSLGLKAISGGLVYKNYPRGNGHRDSPWLPMVMAGREMTG